MIQTAKHLLQQGLLTGALVVFAMSPVQAAPAAAVASAHPLASQVGLDIMAAGGNAFDAAVAVSAALAVVEPYSSGIGGGGFWLLKRASDGQEVMVDGRETAPLAATETLYQDEAGEIIPGLSINGPLAAGIPGQPAALAHISDVYGRLPLAQTLQPAIDLANKGFEVTDLYHRMAKMRAKALQASSAASEIFLPGGDIPATGTRIVQTDLAATLEALATRGRAGFYEGPVAEKLVSGIREAGGIWTEKDLKQYRIIERKPIRGSYRGVQITSAALPSSGGIVLTTILNQLEQFPLQQLDEAEVVHVIVESMRRAYRDRAEYLGDTGFVDVPVDLLISKAYAAGLTHSLRTDRATASDELKPTWASSEKGRDTTHFSIMDSEGNQVAATLSINYPFGSGFVPPGTGVLLNDEMDDFSSKPGAPNVYGLVGNAANAIAPGKRMLSSMTPTFLEDGQRIAVIGTPGGSRIITMVLLATLAFEQGASAIEMVSVPRFHHQYLPDKIEIEAGAISAAAQQKLEALGHVLEPFRWTPGNMQILLRNKRDGVTSGASDPRGEGVTLLAR